MTTIRLEDSLIPLAELVDQLSPGAELVITRDNRPVARLIAEQPPARTPRKPGSAKGLLVIEQEDDEHLKDFAEYMP